MCNLRDNQIYLFKNDLRDNVIIYHYSLWENKNCFIHGRSKFHKNHHTIPVDVLLNEKFSFIFPSNFKVKYVFRFSLKLYSSVAPPSFIYALEASFFLHISPKKGICLITFWSTFLSDGTKVLKALPPLKLPAAHSLTLQPSHSDLWSFDSLDIYM